MYDGPGAVGLPLPATPPIGRDRETAAARALLDAARLVTLVGTGGAGKTRLSLDVARDLTGGFADGTFLVDLAPLRHPGQVLSAIARTLGLRDSGSRPPTPCWCSTTSSTCSTA